MASAASGGTLGLFLNVLKHLYHVRNIVFVLNDVVNVLVRHFFAVAYKIFVIHLVYLSFNICPLYF